MRASRRRGVASLAGPAAGEFDARLRSKPRPEPVRGLRVDLGRCAGSFGEVALEDVTPDWRALIVHAASPAAAAFYSALGFETFPTDPLHLGVLIKDLRRRYGT